jgi:hypothetical protein
VCPDPVGATCKIGTVPLEQADELEAGVRVGSKAAVGEQVQLTAAAAGSAAHSFNGSATDVVIARQTSAPTPTSSPGTSLPPVSLPALSGSGGSAGSDPTGLFPTVAPTVTPSTTPLGLPSVKPHKTVRVTDAAATVPLDSRLIGGQLAGLAVLAGAVVIAVARLSLRTPKPPEGSGDRRPQQ